MIVEGIRYGETCGMCCGPVAGPTIAEVMVYDKDGNSSFVLASLLENDLQISISDYPTFDILYGAYDGSMCENFDGEMEKFKKILRCFDEYDTDDECENGYGENYHGFEKAVDLAILILHEGDDKKIKKKYLKEDIDKLDVPYKPFNPIYDDED